MASEPVGIEYFRAPTPFGDVYVKPIRDGYVYVSTDGGQQPCDRVKYEGEGFDLLLEINRADYRFDVNMKRWEDGTWHPTRDVFLERPGQGRWSASASAKAKAESVLVPAIARWLESDAADAMRTRMAQAQREEDTAELIKLEAELSALRKRESEIAARMELLRGKTPGD